MQQYRFVRIICRKSPFRSRLVQIQKIDRRPAIDLPLAPYGAPPTGAAHPLSLHNRQGKRMLEPVMVQTVSRLSTYIQEKRLTIVSHSQSGQERIRNLTREYAL